MEEGLRRLYILVDKKLPPIYGAVQGGHAVAQYMLEHKDSNNWNNEYLIYLSANVKQWKRKLKRNKLDFSAFHEPDLKDKLTALAVVDDGRRFRKLKLLR